ncbi:hypothetical protein H0H93_012332 [Arthromyces matolae]|nr:hypothetical protein H0H93_012332 [Arthromyces matolae]
MNPSTIRLAAIEYFKVAETTLADANDRYWHAVCTRFYALAYYRVADYDNAFSSATFALQESEDIGQRSGCWVTADLLGKVACARGDYEGSLQHFLYCLQVRKSMGIAPYSQALEGLGVAWTMLGKVADARLAFEKALAEYVPIQSNPTSQAGILRSRFFLKRLTGPNLRPSKEERQALDGWYNQNHLEKVLTSYSPNQT